jgi:hypothetical protein
MNVKRSCFVSDCTCLQLPSSFRQVNEIDVFDRCDCWASGSGQECDVDNLKPLLSWMITDTQVSFCCNCCGQHSNCSIASWGEAAGKQFASKKACKQTHKRPDHTHRLRACSVWQAASLSHLIVLHELEVYSTPGVVAPLLKPTSAADSAFML